MYDSIVPRSKCWSAWSESFLIAAILLLSSTLEAAPGDVRFRAESLTISSGLQKVFASVDVYVDIESTASVLANGWSLAAEVRPLEDAQGDVRFSIPTTSSPLPNLPSAKQHTFTQFDVTQDGKSYGSLGETAHEILAFAPLILPSIDPPSTDGLGNISLPSGAGIVSLPIEIDPGTSGNFIVSFVNTEQWTSVSYIPSLNADGVSHHPMGALLAGLIHVESTSSSSCDFNSDLQCDATDIDLLLQAIRRPSSSDSGFDLNGDSAIDETDRDLWVETLKRTYYGDANLDLVFNTSDFLQIFQAGQYEDGPIGNSTWSTGDWDGNGDFDTRDLVLAFQRNGFEQGPRPTVPAVPEPTLSWLPAASFLTKRRRR